MGRTACVDHLPCSLTCKMGKLSDPMAVTDSRARAIGVNNLKVADASTFRCLRWDTRKAQSVVPCPEIPDSGQETRPNDIRVDALAEKIAHYILIGPRTLLFHGRRIFESNTRIIGQMITE